MAADVFNLVLRIARKDRDVEFKRQRYEVELGQSDYDSSDIFDNPVCQLYAENK
jgi:hypothetical protein